MKMKSYSRRLFVTVLLALCWNGVTPATAAPPVNTYLALGDSVAFGQTDVLPVSSGDQGYVKPFADYLADQRDGKRPKVINLGVPGETSDSFFTAEPPRESWIRDVLANTNYSSETETQFGKLVGAIADEKAAGHRITHVSLALGGNDFFALLGSPEFNEAGADHATLIQQMLLNVQVHYAQILTYLRSELPKAKLLLLTYYNPFTVFGPTHFLNQLTAVALQGHSQIVVGMAKAFKGRPVDVNSAFVAHETVYTNILGVFVGMPLDVAFHPTDAGYAVIAQKMIEVFED
jgi:lysophospholipase L1-like esterase